MKSVNAKFARLLLIRLGFLVVTIELIFSECNFTHSYIGQLTYSCLFSAKILYILYILCLNVESEDIPAEFFMTLGCIPKLSSCGIYSMEYKSKFKIWRNLFIWLSIPVLHRITQYFYHFYVFVKRLLPLRWETDEK